MWSGKSLFLHWNPIPIILRDLPFARYHTLCSSRKPRPLYFHALIGHIQGQFLLGYRISLSPLVHIVNSWGQNYFLVHQWVRYRLEKNGSSLDMFSALCCRLVPEHLFARISRKPFGKSEHLFSPLPSNYPSG